MTQEKELESEKLKLEEQELSFRKKVGSRKFLFSVGVTIATTLLLFMGMVDKVIWKDVILGTLIVYMTGNVTNSIWGKRD